MRELNGVKDENERLMACVLTTAAYRKHLYGCVECGDGDWCDEAEKLYSEAAKAIDAIVGKPGESEEASDDSSVLSVVA